MAEPIKNRKEVLAEVERLGVFHAIDAAENLVRRVKREASGNGAKPAGGLSGFTEKQVVTVIKIMATALTPYFNAIDKRIAELEAKLAAVEKHRGVAVVAARLAELEHTATKYRGIWNEEETYSAGTLVTFQGGMWHCEDANCGVRPGSGSSSWTLANKSRR